MNGCENCLQYLIEQRKTETEYCTMCGHKTIQWKQNEFGTFQMECTNCNAVVAVDLNTPCELDEELNHNVKLTINPQRLLPDKTIIHKLGKVLHLNALQMKEKLECGYSAEIDHASLNQIINLVKENNLEHIIDYECDMKAKYPLHKECKYPYSPMKAYNISD